MFHVEQRFLCIYRLHAKPLRERLHCKHLSPIINSIFPINRYVLGVSPCLLGIAGIILLFDSRASLPACGGAEGD